MNRPRQRRDVGSLLPAARSVSTRAGPLNVLGRAQVRAGLYERLIDWPALVEHVHDEARQIEAMWYARRAGEA